MKKRDISIDALRGVAVTLMVASHTVWFLSDDQNVSWNLIRSWGDSICFITFLFVFGITIYSSLLSKDFTLPGMKRKAVIRLLKLIGAYYLIALAGLLPQISKPDLWVHILKVLAFIEVPGFTEFMLPFVLYTLFCLLLKLFVPTNEVFNNRKMFLVFVSGWIFYALSMSAFLLTRDIHVPEIFGAKIALLIGHDGFLRFPILQYLPVVLLGIYIGHTLSNAEESGKRVIPMLLKLFLFFYFASFLLWISEIWTNYLYMNMFFRWPPSLLFLTFGLCFAVLTLILLKVTNVPPLHKMIGKLGAESMGILVFHIIALRIMEAVGVVRTSSFLYLTGYFIILLLGFIILKYVYSRGKSLFLTLKK
jgi:fucose 4-O-acetylase-like acetyltransferase